MKRSSKPSARTSGRLAKNRSRHDLERVRVVRPDLLEPDHHQAGGAAHRRLQRLERRQQRAGEDVALDPVLLAPVALEALVGHPDHLDRGEPAGGEQPVAGGEEGWVLRVADRLEHLDRGDLRELSLERAVVLEADLDAVGEAGRRDALAGELELLLGERDAGDPRPVLAGRHQREAAPAAADLEHVVAGAQAQLVADRAQLPLLCLLERVALLPERAGVGHRLVEEEPVEVVAEVVVVLDVRPGLAQALPRGEVGAVAVEPREPRAGAPGLEVAHDERDQAGQVVGVPVAGGVGLAEAEARASARAGGRRRSR